ncbi:MAG TPA: hypothetical protein VFD33_01430, partial [Bacillota bacterium]|nr:hypothetical protein [Bacillota bacterium]
MKSVMIGLHRIMSIIIIALIATLIFVGCNSRVSLLPEDTPDLKTPPSVEPLEPTKEPEYTP